jgi:phospholipase C
LTDQTSILRFIEDNWSTGRVGNASFDEYAGKLTRMFDFGGEPRADHLILDPTTGVSSH